MTIWITVLFCEAGSLSSLNFLSGGAHNPVAKILNTNLTWPTSRGAIAYPGGDYIFLFGGYGGRGQLETPRQIIRFTISTEEMKSVGVLSNPKSDATTVLDSDLNIYFVGGRCQGRCNASLDIIYKFNTTSHIIEEIKIKVPFLDETKSIVSYQQDNTGPAYIVANYEYRVSNVLHLSKMTNGVLEAVGNYSIENSSVIEALEVIGSDAFVKVTLSVDKESRVYRIQLDEPFGAIEYSTAPSCMHNSVGIHGMNKPWYLIPTECRSGFIDAYDIRENIITTLDVDNYPEVLLKSEVFREPAYVYIDKFAKLYVFGGSYGNKINGLKYLLMVWTVQFHDDPVTVTTTTISSTVQTTLDPPGTSSTITSTTGAGNEPTTSTISSTTGAGNEPTTSTITSTTGAGNEPTTSTITSTTGAGKKTNKFPLPVMLVAAGVILVILIVGGIFARHKMRNETEGELLFSSTTSWKPEAIVHCHEAFPEITEQDISISQEILGVGLFGVVYKGKYLAKGSQQSIDVAIKQLRSGIGTGKDWQTEIETLKVVRHANIVNFYGAAITAGGASMVFEYCENGSVWSYLQKVEELSPAGCRTSTEILINYIPRNSRTQLIQKDLIRWCHEIAVAMEYLGSKHIIHRDLAARNVLLDENLQVKVADFGLSRELQPRKKTIGWYCYYKTKHDEAKPFPWMAIEALQTQRFTVETDVWALGVTMWEIFSLCKFRPYAELSQEGVLKALKSGKRLEKPSYATDEIYVIMSGCWNENPRRRPSFKALRDQIVSDEVN